MSGAVKDERGRMTLAHYVLRRNGVPLGARGSLRNMLRRAFGAPSFGGFWQHWNPIFGYLLSRHVYSPLRRVLAPAPATVATFVVCGALHDAVATVVRQGPVVVFTPWFFVLGCAVVAGRAAGMDLSTWSWRARAAVHLAGLAGTLVLARVLAASLA